MKQDELVAWLTERLPANLRGAPPRVLLYDDEVIVLLSPELVAQVEAEEDARRASERALIERLREETRPLRMQLAELLQPSLGRTVSWGMRVGGSEALFTTRTLPVMTRLDRRERDVLDTLVAAGVADTRSAALAYCVRVFASEHDSWLHEVRGVLEQVQHVRAKFKLRRRQGPPTLDS
jgi:hypothetical protein